MDKAKVYTIPSADCIRYVQRLFGLLCDKYQLKQYLINKHKQAVADNYPFFIAYLNVCIHEFERMNNEGELYNQVWLDYERN